MVDPSLESSLITKLRIAFCTTKIAAEKKFQISAVTKTAARLFPFSCVTFLITIIRSS